MNTDLKKYMAREINTVLTPCYLGREPGSGEYEYVQVTPQEIADLKDGTIYKFWNRYRAVKKNDRHSGSADLKHTGGKRVYVKVFIADMERKIGARADLIGTCLLLSKNIEWETGYLVTGRGKRKRLMKLNDIIASIGMKPTKTKGILSELKDCGIIVYVKNKGYKLDKSYIAKGRCIPCE